MQPFDDLAMNMTTDGGRAWVVGVLLPASKGWNGHGLTVYDRYSDNIFQPWPQVARWIDAKRLGSAAAGAISLAEAKGGFVRDLLAGMPPPSIGCLPQAAILDILDELDWSGQETRAALQLQDGESIWTREHEHRRCVDFRLGSHLFRISFYRERGDGDEWSMGWTSLTEVPPGSGLFPRAAAEVRRHVQGFLERWNPDALAFGGGDVRGSAFYAAACPMWAPEGYACEIRWQEDLDAQGRDRRADAIFKRIEPTARFGMG